MITHEMAIDRGFEQTLDRILEKLACFEGATEKVLSPMLPAEFVLAENYLKSFPQHGFTASNSIHINDNYLLSPTCCYPVFHSLRDAALEAITLITHKNLCFRSEDYYAKGERQISFLMREYIFFSDDLELVNRWIEEVKEQVLAAISELGLSVRTECATDPFFNANDYKQKFQENQNLKSEFLIDDLAVGSVNLHLKAFSRSCNINNKEGNSVYSACFGLGYDRIYHKYCELE